MSSEVGNYFGVVFLYYKYNPSRERGSLVATGRSDEGIAWYGIG